MVKCSVKGMAMGLGIAWGLYMLLLDCRDWMGKRMGEGLSSLYVGFRPGFISGIVGAECGALSMVR